MIFCKRKKILCENLPKDSIYNHHLNDKRLLKDLKRIDFKKVYFEEAVLFSEFKESYNDSSSANFIIDNTDLEIFSDDILLLYKVKGNNEEYYNMIIVDPKELYHSTFIYQLELV